ncbi:hypothetical protein PH586_17050 [Pseudomonas sp. SA3-5]|uniref:Zinc ribbon domain-containing protein n=1 Tax=Pseudomonas aestuarii TaxID=3018340 RepID=A0ABT4XIS2_9PSED|nr:hypothetical protein [Pseudomonas aestuarii]MDA7088098.1 hypothetical protein [Pseudomonas aestuarii]
MGELRRAEASGAGGLYERLLQRLSVALDEADSLARLSPASPDELELRDLTSAELEFIRAYMDHDLNWLRGWHAAAEELAVIERWPARAAKISRATTRSVGKPLGKIKPLLKRRVQLCCALCGAVVRWRPGQGVQACSSCGSQLFRASDQR